MKKIWITFFAVALMLGIFLMPQIANADIIVDDKSSGFEKHGTYFQEKNVGYANHMYYTYSNGNTLDCWGRWNFTVLDAGAYEVYVHIPKEGATSKQAKYQICHNGQTNSMIIDQSPRNNEWISLGIYCFSKGGNQYVQLNDNTGEPKYPAAGYKMIGYDAVKLTLKNNILVQFSDKVYWLQNGRTYPLSGQSIVDDKMSSLSGSGWSWANNHKVPALFCPQGPVFAGIASNGLLIKDMDNKGKTYYIENQKKRYITGPSAFAAQGFKWADVIDVTAAIISIWPDGPSIPPAEEEPKCSVQITAGPSVDPNQVESGGSCNCSVAVSSSKGHSLSYQWTATDGTFDNPNSQNPVWRAPQNTGSSIASYNLTVTVQCSKCGKSDKGNCEVGVKPEPSRSVTLSISSDYGDPSPSRGAHKYPEGSDITASVSSPVSGGIGIQYICTGFTGGGSVPAKGNGSSIHFTATQDSTLQWSWKTQYYLTASASTGGKVTPVSGWYDKGTSVSLTAIEDSGYAFSGWNGVDKTNSATPATIKMDGAKEVVANFKLSEQSEQPQFKVPWSGEGKITQGNNYASSTHCAHDTWDNTYAIDVALSVGTDVLAPANGVISWCGTRNAGGMELAIDCPGPTGKTFTMVFCHLSKIIKKRGKVKQGEIIAKSGNTGNNTTGPHLHFHLWNGTGGRDSHTMPIERLVMKQIGNDADFREYNARQGELDHDKIAHKKFESNNSPSFGGTGGNEPAISTVTPDSGKNSESIQVTICGDNFQEGAEVELFNDSVSIFGTATIIAASTTLTTIFDLKNSSPGSWSIMVTNPDDQSTTLIDSFVLVEKPAGAGTVVKGIIAEDATWTVENSPYIVVDNILVESGNTLRIEPGVKVRFDGPYCLQVEGTLKAIGTSKDMIAFTTNKPSAATWCGIKFNEKCKNNVQQIKYCLIEYAGCGISYTTGLHDKGTITMAVFSHNKIEHCGTGISLSFTGDYPEVVKIDHNTIQYNTTGLQCDVYAGATIAFNTISSNKAYGVYVTWPYSRVNIGYNTITENGTSSMNDGSGVKSASFYGVANYNNIYNNAPYDFYNAYINHERPMDAKNNWWGTTNISDIGKHIHGEYDSFGRDTVKFKPILTAPVQSPVTHQVCVTPGAVSAGTHSIVLRASISGIGVLSPAITEAEYFMEINGSGIKMSAADGAFDSSEEEAVAWISTAGWTIGTRTIYVRAKDAEDRWGMVGSAIVTVGTPTLPAATLSITPAIKKVDIGATFTLVVKAENAEGLTGADCFLSFNPQVLEAKTITSMLLPIISSQFNNSAGHIDFGAGLFSGSGSSSGTLAVIEFMAKNTGNSSIVFNSDTANNRETVLLRGSERIPFEAETAKVEVTHSGGIKGCVVLVPGHGTETVNHAGIRIDVAGTSLGTYTDSAGFFTICSVPAGSYRITANIAGASIGTWTVVVHPGTDTVLQNMALLNGDATGDGKVNTFDFARLRAAYFEKAGRESWNDTGDFTRDGFVNADFSGDAVVNIQDFGILRTNYFKQMPVSVSDTRSIHAPMLKAASMAAMPCLFIAPAVTTINAVGEEFPLAVKIEDGKDLAGIDFYLCFNPELLEVTRIEEGTLIPQITSQVDNATGIIAYGAGKISGNVEGSGTVATIFFKVKSMGTSAIRFDTDSQRNTTLLDSSGKTISFTTTGSIVMVEMPKDDPIEPDSPATSTITLSLHTQSPCFAGSEFMVDICAGNDISQVTDLFSLHLNLSCSKPEVVKIIEAVSGEIMGTDSVFITRMMDDGVEFTVSRRAAQEGINSSGVVSRAKCRVSGEAMSGTVSFNLNAVKAFDSKGNPINYRVVQEQIKINRVIIKPVMSSGQSTPAGSITVLEIQVGDENNPVANLQGVSFRLKWTGANLLSVHKVEIGSLFDAQSLLYSTSDRPDEISVCVAQKSNHTGASGYGSIARIYLKAGENVSAETEITLNIDQVTPYGAVSLIPCPGNLTIIPQEWSCIWPGDTNNDGVVNIWDITSVAVFWEQTGPARSEASLKWKAECAPKWGIKVPPYPGGEFADTNGNGRIAIDDIMAIGINWGQTHSDGHSMAPARGQAYFSIDHALYAERYRAMLSQARTLLADTLNGQVVVAALEELLKISESASPYAYPNPYKPTTTHQGKHLGFAGLSGNWIIKLYNVAGELVESLSGNSTATVWDGADTVASGVYIYVVTDGKNNKKIGKVAIIR